MANVHLDDIPSSKNKIQSDVLKQLEAGMYAERSAVATWDDLEKVAKFKIGDAFQETKKIEEAAREEMHLIKASADKLSPEEVQKIETEKGIDNKIIEVGGRFEFICAELTARIRKIIEEEKQKVAKEKNAKDTEKNIDEIEKSMQKIIKIYGKFKEDVNRLEEELRLTLDEFRTELKIAQGEKIMKGLSINK